MNRGDAKRRRLLAIAGIGSLLFLQWGADVVRACPVCLPYPEESVVDHLLAADAIALARENPARPFELVATEVLRGEVPDGAPALFVDSSTRRWLSLRESHAVLVVRTTNEGVESWSRVGLFDDEFGPLVRTILERLDAWGAAESGPAGSEASLQRFRFFSRYLGHGNSQIRRLAHLEVARAPYPEIRTLRGVLPREQIRSFLEDIRNVEWWPLYIVLLAQSEHPDDRSYIRNSFESATKWNLTTNLAAWATAAIEIDGDRAIATIRMRYFGDATRSSGEVEAILPALSVHSLRRDPALHEEIARSYATLVDTHPRLATRILPDLLQMERWELIGAFRNLLREEIRLSFGERMLIRRYLYAGAATRPETAPSAATQPHDPHPDSP